MRRELVQAVHATPMQMVAVVTGGGSDALAALLKEPGASDTLLEANIPYGSESLSRLLGAPPEQACSERTARALAIHALLRALALAPNHPRDQLAGVSCTASLATHREKRGEHRCHIAVHTLQACAGVSLVLDKGARSRAEEEELVSDLLLNCIARVAGVTVQLPLATSATESPVRRTTEARQGWADLLLGKTELVFVTRGPAAPAGALLPGAFNPLHRGHLAMAACARDLLHCEVALELTVVNADKPPLDFQEIATRVDAIGESADLYLTRAPTFAEKARIFPGITFVVGTDTLRRIAEPRFYGDSLTRRAEALGTLRDAGCRFLVFGRLADGRFETLDDLDLPRELRALCDGVTEAQFRIDLSSTEIRRGRIG